MSTVGVRELKNRLTHYLARTKQGEEIVATERGKPIALLRAIQAVEQPASLEARLAQLAAHGFLTLPTRKRRRKVRRIRIAGPPISRTILTYADSSALIKRFVAEKGSTIVDAFMDPAESVATAKLAYAEVYAALMRRRREGHLSAGQYALAAQQFDGEWPTCVPMDFREDILTLVRQRIKRHPLKGSDAIHLGSALALSTTSGVQSPSLRPTGSSCVRWERSVCRAWTSNLAAASRAPGTRGPAAQRGGGP